MQLPRHSAALEACPGGPTWRPFSSLVTDIMSPSFLVKHLARKLERFLFPSTEPLLVDPLTYVHIKEMLIKVFNLLYIYSKSLEDP